jgi:predicted RNase H-like HicB family nuclease
MTYKFTSIINREGKWYVARCAELGVVSQGKNIQDAQKNLKEAAELYLESCPKTAKYPTEAPLITTLEINHA